ncbi:MAG: EAL domain-containing protein [Rhodocyclales bacterium]|nr:EAL domain-containing protein [Rhodocyclales bacterium]
MTLMIGRPFIRSAMHVPKHLDGPLDCAPVIYALTPENHAHAEQELRRHKQRLEAALKATGIGIFEVDARTGAAEVSDSYAAIFGYADSKEMDLSLVGRFSRMHEADRPRVEAAYRELADGRRGEVQMEYRARSADGAFQWFRVDGHVAERDPHGCPTHLIGIIQNIERFRLAQEQARLSQVVFDNTHDGIIITDTDGRILAANPAFTAITGYTAPEVLGQTPRLLKSGRHDAKFYQQMWRSLLRDGAWQGEIWDRKKSGVVYPEWLSISAVGDTDSVTPTHFVATFSDLTEIKTARAQIDHVLRHDPLTGLPNEKTLAELPETRLWGSYSLVLIDIDHFKLINDAHGHDVGDLALVAVAERLRANLCQGELLARHGSDEFIIAGRTPVSDRASALLGLFESPFRVAGTELSLTVSIGGCSYPDDGGDFYTLLYRAESAARAAKSSGRNTFRSYRAPLDAGASRRLSILDGLRRAMHGEGLVLHFQPQVDLGSGAVVGFEALMRWRHPVLGSVSPCEFIPFAEESGTIVALGAWALTNACRQLATWQRSGFAGTIAVNVSSVQIHRGALLEQVFRALTESACDPAGLRLEITESVVLEAPQAVLDMLLALKRLGISLAIDDFGTGYSNLVYLCRLNVDEIKIDRAFVANLSSGEADVAIVRAIIQMANAIGAGVIAEGIENANAADRLAALGCRRGQGYFFGHPVAAEEIPIPKTPSR